MPFPDIIIYIFILIILYLIYNNIIDKFNNTLSQSTENSNEPNYVVIKTPAKNTLWNIVRWIL
jgi:hypothetical protein